VGIDDAHLLDDGSAALVHQLAMTAAAFVLVTVRSGESVPDPIVALWKDGLADRLEVGALSEQHVEQLIPKVLGGQVDGPTIARLWEATRGNVLFLRELVFAGLESGTLLEDGGVWSWRGPVTVSARLEEVVAARMGTLDPEQTSLLEVIALGEPASASFLQRLFSPTALEAAERRGMAVVQKGGRRLLVRLAHPLYGEVVRARCPALRARAVHHELAAAIEATGARRREDLLRLAMSRLGAGEIGPPELLLAGARRAYAFDPALSERLSRAAAEAGGGIPAQYGVAVSLFVQGRFSEIGLDAGGQTIPLNDSERAMEAVGKAYALWMSSGRPAAAEEVLLRAEDDIKHPHLREKLKETRGLILLYAGRPAEAIAADSQVLDRPGVSDRSNVTVAQHAVLALAVLGRSDQAVAIAERWIDAAHRLAEELPLAAGRLRASESWALCFAGRLDEAGALARKEYRRALSNHAHETTAMSAVLLGQVALARGRVQEAARWLREAAALSRSPKGFSLLPMCLAALACAAALGGDLTTAQDALVEADDIANPGMAIYEPEVCLAGAWVAAARGEVSTARAVALDAANKAEELGANTYALLALHDVARLGDARAVATRLRHLSATMDGPLAPTCADHAEALAAHDGCRLDQVATSFERMGADLLAAEAASEAAAAHRAAGKTRSMLASSTQARRLLDRCEGATTPALSGLLPDPLTPREREMASLAASGLTSTLIAQRLGVSARTVENHLQRSYAKLGVASREELRAVLLQPEAGRGPLS
jgi:DNA-binding CsgD family transcriptional regulator/tetratricopeptide (TPR) repeat protein